MAYPLDVQTAPIQTPPQTPAGATADLGGAATYSDNYIGGIASGSILSYPGADDFAWFELFYLDDLPSRIRSSFEVTLGRTLVGTPQADVSSSETAPRAEGLNVGDQIAYPTMIRPVEPIALLRAIEDGGGLPVYEQPISYETRLAALGRMYPPSLFATTQEAIGVAEATAQEVLQHLFDVWTELFPEFRAKPVPPLVLFTPNPETGVYDRTLTTDRIFLKQPEGRERSIQTLLEDFRQIFVGYGVSVDSSGDVVIIPPPWAAGADRRVIASRAYRLGPGSWSPSLASIGAVGLVNVTSAAWELEADYAGAEVEVQLGIRALVSADPAGPEDPSLISLYSPQRAIVNAVIEPNAPDAIVELDVVSSLSSGVPILVTARYGVRWERPGATGGAIVVSPLNTPTSAGTGLFVGEIEIRLFLAHAAILTAYSSGGATASVARTVTGDEIAGPVPSPAFDGSRVINRQLARYADFDFVEDTALLPTLYTNLLAATGYDPGSGAEVDVATFQPFVDEDDEPLVVGEEIEVVFDYLLLRSSSSSGGGVDRDGFTRSGSVTLHPGETKTVSYNLNGEVPLTFGFLVTIRFRYTTRNGVPGLVVDFPRYAIRSNNALLTRPWFGHHVIWDTNGSVYGPTGEELEVTYDETSGEEGVITSQALYGIREGVPIEVNFFRVTYDDLLDLTSSIVRFHMNPRARYAGVELTQASEITPDDLGRELLLPWGVAAALEAYRYDDARSYDGSRTARRLDLVLLYALIDSAGSFASDVENAVEETAGISGQSIALDAD